MSEGDNSEAPWDGRGFILLGNENKSKLSFAFLSFFYNFVIE
jgi:hypothetical protein